MGTESKYLNLPYSSDVRKLRILCELPMVGQTGGDRDNRAFRVDNDRERTGGSVLHSKVGISAEPQNQQINLALLDVSKYFVLGMANTHE